MKTALRSVSLLILVAAVSGTASAYNGPGLGLATIAVVLGIIGSIFFWLCSAIWYPIKRKLKGKKSTEDSDLDDLPAVDSGSGER